MADHSGCCENGCHQGEDEVCPNKDEEPPNGNYSGDVSSFGDDAALVAGWATAGGGYPRVLSMQPVSAAGTTSPRPAPPAAAGPPPLLCCLTCHRHRNVQKHAFSKAQAKKWVRVVDQPSLTICTTCTATFRRHYTGVSTSAPLVGRFLPFVESIRCRVDGCEHWTSGADCAARKNMACTKCDWVGGRISTAAGTPLLPQPPSVPAAQADPEGRARDESIAQLEPDDGHFPFEQPHDGAGLLEIDEAGLFEMLSPTTSLPDGLSSWLVLGTPTPTLALRGAGSRARSVSGEVSGRGDRSRPRIFSGATPALL